MKILKQLIPIALAIMLFNGCSSSSDSKKSNLIDVTDTNNSENNNSENNNSENNNSENNEDPNTEATQFYSDIVEVLTQTEDDEPLEIVDTEDTTSNFNSLLK
jgi:PBP1b-binding outer membrane lipoprotein LpoB